jgi:uncharacterized protein (TIGR02246 family)
MDDVEIATLYRKLLDGWNERDAGAMAALCQEDASFVGFDGSMMNGREEIESSLAQIFADHLTARYVAKVREVRLLTPDVALLRAVAGLIPHGRADLNPVANAVQSLVTVRTWDGWRIALFQNTPAQFHGRPELSQALTDELRRLI